MKVNTKDFKTFLEKVVMTGDQTIKECVLNFSANGLTMAATTESKTGMSEGSFTKSNFEDYEELNKVAMTELATVIKVLDRFGEKIKIEKNGNVLNISSGSKKVDIELVSENFLSTESNRPDLEFNDTFIMSAKDLGEIIKDVQLNKDSQLIIETSEKKVTFSNTGKYKFNTTIEAPMVKGGSKVKFGKPFIEAVAKLDGQLEISVGTDYPVKILEKTDDKSVVTIIVAPQVENS